MSACMFVLMVGCVYLHFMRMVSFAWPFACLFCFGRACCMAVLHTSLHGRLVLLVVLVSLHVVVGVRRMPLLVYFYCWVS